MPKIDGDVILSAGLDTTRIADTVKNLQKTVSKGLKNAIRIGLGVRSVFALIRKLRRELIEGFGNLVQVHEPFNQAVSQIMTSLNLLKNTFAASFAPIIEVVAPILSKFINMIAEAVAQVGMFIAALTGKEYVRAAAVQMNYAESVNKSASSSKNAAKATKQQTKEAKELKKTLAGFDDVEILHEDKDNDTTSDTTGGGTPNYSFGSAPIGGAVDKFAKDFKAAWAKADFTDIGKLVGTKLYDALKRIPWDRIKSALKSIATGIATFLNGFLSVPGLFSEIGNTLAQVLNSVVIFLQTFVTTLDWAAVGTAIKDSIVGLLSNIDWQAIYSTASSLGSGIGTALQNAIDNPEIWTLLFSFITGRINTLFYAVLGFISAVNWGSVGVNIATGLNNAIATIDWTTIGATLVSILNAAFQLLYNFAVTFDFGELARGIAHTISTLLNDTDWKTGGASVAVVISNLISAFEEFLLNVDWMALISGIVDVVKGFLQEFDWAAVAELTGVLIGGAILALVKLGSALWEQLKEFGANLVEGGWEGIKEKLIGFATWAYDNIARPMLEGIKKAFHINSPSKLMQPLGGFILEGLKEGILDKITNIGTWIETNVSGPICNFFKKAFGINSPSTVFKTFGAYLMDGLNNGISDNIKAPQTALAKSQETLQNVFSAGKQLGAWKTIGDKLLSAGLTLGIKSGARSSINAITAVAKDMKNYGQNQAREWVSIGSAIIEQLARGISNSASTVGNAVYSIGQVAQNSFNRLSWDSIGNNIGWGIYNGLSRMGGTLDNLAWNTAVSMYNSACYALGIASPSKKFAWVGEMISQGLGNGIADNEDMAIDAVNNMVGSLTDAASSSNPELSLDTSISSWVDSLDDVLTKFSDVVVSKFDNLINTLSSITGNSLYTLPPISSGRVVPSASVASVGSDERITKILEALDDLSAEMLSSSQLTEILATVIQRYLNIDFYIGDEQIARHANAGNSKLNRRFKPVNV